MKHFDVNEARKRFGQSPMGTWASYLGGGHDMLIGIRLEFHPDGTGTMEEWGFDHFHIDPTYVTEPKFQWKSIGERQIELTHRGVTRSVNYDFRVSENEYHIKELRMFECSRQPDKYGDVGFWVSPYSLVHREPPVGFFRQLWKGLLSEPSFLSKFWRIH